MFNKLLEVAKEFSDKAKNIGMEYKRIDEGEIDYIENKINIKLPDWYKKLMTSIDLIGIEFDYHLDEEEKEYHPIKIASIKQVEEEMLGIEKKRTDFLIKNNYFCFGMDLLGGGDYYFINIKDDYEKGIKLYQLAHDDDSYVEIIAEDIIEMFKNADI